VWSGLNNRDRNRVALEGELAGLAIAGASAVHCVTGDHVRTGHRPDAAPVFDLDSTETAALARSLGHLVSVGESPATPPRGQRPARLLQKERAGAELCFVNHCGGVEPVARFIAAARELGSGLGFIPCIPVVVDRRSAAVIRSFTSLVLPEGFVERIEAAADPRAAGIAAAIDLGERMLAIDGVVGVNLSGGRDDGERQLAEAMAAIADGIAR
jgi:5,10-methylenetetrahydrofolate reductase